jgi:hypothetical protein
VQENHTMSITVNEFYVKRSGMTGFLDGIEESPGRSALSIYLPAGMSPDEIRGFAANAGGPDLPEEITQAVSGSPVGGVIFPDGETGHLVLPPFSTGEKVVFSGIVTDSLRSLLERDYLIGLVLVHLGTYAVGVCRWDSLVSSKVGTGLVHGRTKKGGSSSARFQRRRQNQAREFLERVCIHAREHLVPYEKTLDYLLYGGPRQTVQQLQKECPFLKVFEDQTLPVTDVPALRRKVLEATITRLWSSRVIEWGPG